MMIGIVDHDYQRSDLLQDALARHGFVSFVVNVTSDDGSRSLIRAADMLVVAAELLSAVLLVRQDLKCGVDAADDADVAVPFSEFSGATYHVVMRSSVGRSRPDWQLFTAGFALETKYPSLSRAPQSSEFRLAS